VIERDRRGEGVEREDASFGRVVGAHRRSRRAADVDGADRGPPRVAGRVRVHVEELEERGLQARFFLELPPGRGTAKEGAQLFASKGCVACHGAGVAGAPKFGDKAAWAPRVAEGADTLHKHALGGFQGKNGYMPPKGGRTDLSDQSVVNAVDYMVSNSK